MPKAKSKTLLFDATSGASEIFERLRSSERFEEGRLVRKVYGDGEIGHFIQPDTKPQGAHPSLKGTLIGRRVTVVGDLSTAQNVMDTYDVCNNAFDETARELTLIVPEASLPEDAVKRQALLELFAAIPHRRKPNKLILAPSNFDGTWHYTEVKTQVPEWESAYDEFGHDAKPILFYTRRYEYLAREMMQHRPGFYELGECFYGLENGKTAFHGLQTDVRGRRVIIVSGTIDAEETLEQYYLARAVAHGGALSREIIESYFAYGTMERKTKSGEAVKAKIRARMLSSLPACDNGSRIIFVDLHADGIPYYLEGGVQPFHTYVGKHMVATLAREMLGLDSTYWLGTVDVKLPAVRGKKDIVLGSMDFGRFKWVASMGDDVGLEKAYGRKERIGDDEVVFVGAHGYVLRKHLLGFDDKLGTGGTATKACLGYRLDQYGKRLLNKIKKLGAENVPIPEIKTVFACSHFVGNKAVLTKLFGVKDVLGRELFTRIIASNSHPVVEELARDPEFAGRFQSKSIAPLLNEAVGD